MTRILALLLALLCGADAAAQTLPGAFTIPAGDYEYRWKTLVRPDGTIERTPVSGFLRLHDNGRFAHRRRVQGSAWSHQSGSYRPDGNFLYIDDVSLANAATVQTDTFVVRHPGDRLFLFLNLHEAGKVEYELAVRGAPVERTPVPGLIPELYGYVAEILYYEHGAGAAPVPALRRYARSFPSATSRWIWMQAQIEYPTALAGGQVTLACRLREPAGTEVVLPPLAISYTAGSTTRYPTMGLGTGTPGNFAPGTYRLLCTVDGAPMMEGSFEVT